MKIRLNGKEKEFPNKQNLKEIIIQFCPNTPAVVAEVNGNIIKDAQWEKTQIQNGDSVELLTFMGGGIVN